MAFAKDKWTKGVTQSDGKVTRERDEKRWGRGKRWLAVWTDPQGKERSRTIDPASEIQYESKWRLHVAPVFGRRPVKSILPSEVAVWLTDLMGAWTVDGQKRVLGAQRVSRTRGRRRADQTQSGAVEDRQEAE
ncbi:hypothetical protein [Kribbella monticola]|uniref:hypothetical protein n=1 Tax=Kribbella monticola TaxID=2185285 RepID=UPI0013005BFA|nr:hypothetical protein [Kribbella monticola]